MGILKDCLRTVLRETAVAPDADERGMVTLRELRRGKPMEVQVSHVPSTATVISLNKTSQHPILRAPPRPTRRSWQRICDYLLIDEGLDDCRVTMVELKSTLDMSIEGLEQLRRSLPIAKYLLSVCEVELQRSWPGQFSYALIAEKRARHIDKQPVRPRIDIETQDYEGIRVSVGVGTRFSFTTLAA